MQTVLLVDQRRPRDDVIYEAAAILRASGIVCLPSDTCYGLSCLATDKAATERLRRLKVRSSSKPFILIVGAIDQARSFAEHFGEAASALARAFWPGRLTIVVPFRQADSCRIVHDVDKIALRVPSSLLLRQIMVETGCPLWSSSANSPDCKPPAALEDIPKRILDNVDLILNGGRLTQPSPSTIIDLSVERPTIIRRGPININDILSKTGIKVTDGHPDY